MFGTAFLYRTSARIVSWRGEAEEKWRDEQRDERWIEEQVEGNPPMYWFIYKDELSQNTEFVVKVRRGLGESLSPSVFGWATGESLLIV